MAHDDEGSRPWRGWHVIGRFLPMIVLGVVFVIVGLTLRAPHHGVSFGVLFIWVGGILIVAAVLGMMFTKCPLDYETRWVVCAQEPDVERRPHGRGYHRRLSVPSEDD
jgi:hypothetical protein